jgi:hypothetical protein
MFGAAAGLAIAAIAVTVWAGRTAQPVSRTEVMLLYVGAEDCAPCQAWQKRERADFLASADFARLTYREVKSRHLEDVLKDENWPEDLRGYRNRLRRSDGVPLWLVVSDRKIVEQRFGATEWRERVLPRIRSLLR